MALGAGCVHESTRHHYITPNIAWYWDERVSAVDSCVIFRLAASQLVPAAHPSHGLPAQRPEEVEFFAAGQQQRAVQPRAGSHACPG